MEPATSLFAEPEPRHRAAGPAASPLRLVLAAVVWAAIGFIHARDASPSILWAAVVLSACLGIGILQLAGDDTRWTAMLAAVLLASSPLLQKAWELPQGPAWDRVMLLKTLVLVCGLLLLGRLGSSAREGEERAEGPPVL